MPKRAPRLLLEDILTAVGKIQRYVDGMDHTTFLADDKTVDAVVRNLEIIGEAVCQLSDDFKRMHPDVPWSKMAGLRDRIVHDYLGIDLGIVWHIIQNELSILRADLETML